MKKVWHIILAGLIGFGLGYADKQMFRYSAQFHPKDTLYEKPYVELPFTEGIEVGNVLTVTRVIMDTNSYCIDTISLNYQIFTDPDTLHSQIS